MHTRGLRPQGHTNGSIHPRLQLIPSPGDLGDRVPPSLTHFHRCPTPPPWSAPGLRCSIPVKYGPFPGRCSRACRFWFIISYSLRPFYFSALLAFDCFSEFIILNFYPFPQENPILFFPSLSQLINNRDSTALDRSISCLLNRTAGSISWGPHPGLWRAHRLSLGGEHVVHRHAWGEGANGGIWAALYLTTLSLQFHSSLP